MSLSRLLAQLDPDEHVCGKQFERLCRWYLRNSPRYRFKHVWLWRDWPDRWAGDEAGIDLIAEQHDGGLWAIQAKGYDPARWINKRDIDSWLSESNRPGFVYRLLLASTDRLGRRARRAILAQAIPAGWWLRTALESELITWPSSLDDLRPPPFRQLQPRRHQERENPFRFRRGGQASPRLR